jgi:hypothetical protein
MMMEGYSDAGPLLDVVLYREGASPAGETPAAVWRAVVDISNTGDLASQTPMAPFRVERQVRAYSGLDGGCGPIPGWAAGAGRGKPRSLHLEA